MNSISKPGLPTYQEIEQLVQSAFKGLINEDLNEKNRLEMIAPFAGISIPIHGIFYVMTEYGIDSVPEVTRSFFEERYYEDRSRYLSTLDAEWPGLFFGLAGNILGLYCAEEMNIISKDENYNSLHNWIIMDNFILYLAEGISGQLLAAVLVRQMSIDLVLEDKLQQLIENVLNQQAADGSWPLETFCLAEGSAGVILALIKSYQHRPDERVKEAIIKGLDYMMPEVIDREPKWYMKKKKSAVDISLMNGTTGIALIFLYGYEILRDPGYKATAKALLDELPDEIYNCDFSLLSGLAGIGLVYVEAVRITGYKKWMVRLSWLYELFDHMVLQNEAGNIYWNMRGAEEFDAGFLSGNAGIIYFLVRMQGLLRPDAALKGITMI